MITAPTRLGALLCLVLAAAPALAQDRAALERQLDALTARAASVEATYQRLNDANAQRIRDLEARLTTLSARRPRPRAEIVRAQIALAERDDQTAKLILGRDRRLEAVAARRQAVAQQLEALGPPIDVSKPDPAEPQTESAPAAEESQPSNTGTRDAMWGATNIFRRDVLHEDIGPRGQIPLDPNRPAPQQGAGHAEPEGPADTWGEENETPTPLAEALATDAVQEDVGAYPAGRATRAYDALLPADQQRFNELLAAHDGNPTAQAALVKALSSGNTLEDIGWLSGEIEGKDADWIRTNTTLTGHGQDGLMQQYQASCVPTAMQALRGEFDPVYSLRHRQGGDVHVVDESDPEAHNADLAREQSTLLQRPYDGGLADSQGDAGRPTPRDAFGQGRAALDDVANVMSPYTGLEYQEVLNADGSRLTADQSLPIIDASLRQGVPVPLATGGQNGAAHAVLAYDVRDADRPDGTTEPEYRIFDPWSGTSTWVPESDVANHSMQAVEDQPVLYRVLEPGQADRAENPELAYYNGNGADPTRAQAEPRPVEPAFEPVAVEPIEFEPIEPIKLLEPLKLRPVEVEPEVDYSTDAGGERLKNLVRELVTDTMGR